MTLYDDLDIPKDADKPTIKKAFRKKAQKLHPDKENGDAEKFAMVKLACDVLMNDERRKQYDETGTTNKAKQPKDVARERVAVVFDGIISREDFCGDIIKEARSTFIKSLAEFKGFRKKIDKRLKQLNKLSGRVKAKKTNLFQEVIDRQIIDIKQAIHKNDQDGLVFDQIFELLNDYEDNQPEEAFRGFGTINFYPDP